MRMKMKRRMKEEKDDKKQIEFHIASNQFIRYS